LNFHYFPDFHAEWERWDPSSPERISGMLPAPTCGDLFDGQGEVYNAGGVDLIAKFSHFQNRMNTCFDLDQPIWITELAEHGYAGNPDSLTKQAYYVIRGNARALAAGAETVVWYALATPNDSYEQGLLFDDLTPKPAFYAYKTLVAELTRYHYLTTLDILYSEGYSFINGSGLEKLVAWGSGVLSVAPASQLRVVDYLGNVTWVNDGSAGDVDGLQDGSIQLQLTESPVFVEISIP
jgi:hypothetical protein